jgi:hypothetical protein
MRKIEYTGDIGTVAVTAVTVADIGFARFVECVEVATARQNAGSEFKTALQRERMKAQCMLVDGKGVSHPLLEESITILDPRLGIQILDAILQAEDSVGGSIVRKGDGITKSIVYKLGKPIKTSGTDATEINELEFLAKTFGDVEQAASETSDFARTLSLIRTCAAPLADGKSTTLQALPSWAIDHLSLADGFEIMKKVLPAFFG